MASVGHEVDQEWAQILSSTSGGKREVAMHERYGELADLPEDERRRRLRAMTFAEYSFPDAELREITVSRLRTWLTMDPEAAKRIAASLEAVMAEMPGDIAWRRVALVQTMAREFSSDDVLRLRELVPGIFGGQPAATDRPDRTTTQAPAEARRKKPWWAFWRS
jgi:hypothetical protein